MNNPDSSNNQDSLNGIQNRSSKYVYLDFRNIRNHIHIFNNELIYHIVSESEVTYGNLEKGENNRGICNIVLCH